MGRRPARPDGVHRLTGGDLMQWQADVGPVPQHIGAVLLLDDADRPAPDRLAAVLTERLGAVAALGRRPVRAPLGGGGWYWADDDRDAAAHVRCERLPAADGDAVLAATADVVLRRLPRHRSPWRAVVLVAPDGRPAAVVVVLHHVLADGLAGLAVLDAVADRAAPWAAPGAPRPVVPGPSRATLVRDAWGRRLAALRRAPAALHGVRRLRDGRAELGRGVGAAPRSPLNRPTGPHRRLQLVTVDEAPVRAAAHALGASVNDVVLVAVGETFGALAAAAGAPLDRVVVSVPVAVRDAGARSGTGNAVGVMPVAVATTGPLADRVRRVSAVRRGRLLGDHGRSLPVVLAAFRLIRALGLVGWFLDRQRLVNTFVSALPPLPGPLRVGGARVGAVVPVVMNQGNSTVAFTSVRYDGRLTVAIGTDPDVGPDGGRVTAGLQGALAAVVTAAREETADDDTTAGPRRSRMTACPSRSAPTPTGGSWAASPGPSRPGSPTSPASLPAAPPSTSAPGRAP